MAHYHFPLTLAGTGRTVEEAWADACESFALDPGPCPEEGEYELTDLKDEDEDEEA